MKSSFNQWIKFWQARVIQTLEPFIKVAKEKPLFLFLAILFLFLPGENFYERLRVEFKEPLVRGEEIVLPELTDYPVNVAGAKTLSLSAKSAIVVDVSSKVAIYAKNPAFHLLPASTTKMMTGLVVLENYDLDTVLTVPSLDEVVGRHMNLVAGEKMTVRNLLYGLLVHSANDAALTLASAYPSGKEEFIYAMEKKAKELGLINTHFANFIGLDQANHYSTVFELAQLAAYAMKNQIFAEMVKTAKMTVFDVTGEHQHDLENTNELIGGLPGVKGVKTGWTEGAGECLVAYVERNGREIITVLLGSRDRFGETARLIDWVFENFQWQEITSSTEK
jgi:D-alanyl-D-alanine carboxypeptidase (penicillin-binding protein 5/6)